MRVTSANHTEQTWQVLVGNFHSEVLVRLSVKTEKPFEVSTTYRPPVIPGVTFAERENRPRGRSFADDAKAAYDWVWRNGSRTDGDD